MQGPRFPSGFLPQFRTRTQWGSAGVDGPPKGPASRRGTRTFGCLHIWGNEGPAPISSLGNPLAPPCSGRAGSRVGRLANGTSCIPRNGWSLLPRLCSALFLHRLMPDRAGPSRGGPRPVSNSRRSGNRGTETGHSTRPGFPPGFPLRSLPPLSTKHCANPTAGCILTCPARHPSTCVFELVRRC